VIGRHRQEGERLVGARNIIGLLSDIGGAVAATSMLGAVAVGGGSAIVGVASNRPWVVLAGCAFAGGVTFGGACMHAVEIRRSSSVESQLGYRWVDATYTYSIHPSDPHRHCQTTDVVIRAIRDGVRTFTNVYRWSGSGEETPPKVTSYGHSLAGEIERSMAWRRYDVRLDPPLRRGEMTTISLVQNFHDTDERFELFLAKSVHEPTGRLTLRVKLPVRLIPERAWIVEQVSLGPRARVLQRDVLSPKREGDLAILEWRIARPVLGRSYQLRWGYLWDRSLYDQPPDTQPQDEPQAR
jgi:hypothetical protein